VDGAGALTLLCLLPADGAALLGYLQALEDYARDAWTLCGAAELTP